MQCHSFAQNRTGLSVALNFYCKDSLASRLTLAGLRKTACRLSTRHDRGNNLTAKNAEKPKTTSNNQHPTSRKAPRSKRQRTTAESHIQSREVWQLGLGAWIFSGCWMLDLGCCPFPDDRARRLGCRNLLRAGGIPCPSRASMAP